MSAAYRSPFGTPQSSPRRMAKGDKSWIDVQRNTFTNWTNEVLRKNGESIDDLAVDLSDGFMLKCMYEVLADKDFGRFKKAKMRISKVENLSRVLKKFSDDGLRLVNIGAEDICDGNLKIILGFVWSLITKYQIMAMRQQLAKAPGSAKASGGGKSPTSPKKILLQWVNAQLANYPTSVKDFRKSWMDGCALCDLVDSFAPGELLPAHDRPEGALARIEKAMSIAEERLGVPRVLEREHLMSGADDLSTMTYISYFQKADLLSANPPAPEPKPEAESKIMEETLGESPKSKATPGKKSKKTSGGKTNAAPDKTTKKKEGTPTNDPKPSTGVSAVNRNTKQKDGDSASAANSDDLANVKKAANVAEKKAKKPTGGKTKAPSDKTNTKKQEDTPANGADHSIGVVVKRNTKQQDSDNAPAANSDDVANVQKAAAVSEKKAKKATGGKTKTAPDKTNTKKQEGSPANGADHSIGVVVKRSTKQQDDEREYSANSDDVANAEEEAAAAKKKRAAKKKAKKKSQLLPCSNCKRVLPDRNFKMFQKTKGDLRQCIRCVRREPVFTEPRA